MQKPTEKPLKMYFQGFIQDFELGGGEQDVSRMIVVCEMHAWGSGKHAPRSPPPLPRKILNLYTSQIASDPIWDKISEHFDDTYVQ